MRRSRKLDFVIVAAIGVVVAVAAADSLRPNGSSPPQVAALDPDAGELSLGSPRPSPRQQVLEIGARWANHFAYGNRWCEDMTQPFCERIACKRIGNRKIENCTPPTRAYRRSFAGVFVSDVAFKRNRAAARLSNGEVIELWGDGGGWLVHKIGGNAGRGFWVARKATTDNRE